MHVVMESLQFCIIWNSVAQDHTPLFSSKSETIAEKSFTRCSAQVIFKNFKLGCYYFSEVRGAQIFRGQVLAMFVYEL